MTDLAQHFTTGRLVRYTLPMMAMLLVSSAYSIVDGLFVSNVVGKTALASVTLVAPLASILSTLGVMMGTGGSAIVGNLLGAGQTAQAQKAFSSIVAAVFVAGLAASVAGIALMDVVIGAFGATGEMASLAAIYGRIAFCALPLLMLQFVFQMFSATSGKPNLGLASSIIAGVLNIVLDAFFMLVLKWGVAGAALATSISECCAGLFMLVMFLKGRAGALRLVRPSMDVRLFGRAAYNGLSEMVSNMAASVVVAAYNYQLMRLVGEDGVAAYAIIEYASMLTGAVMGGFVEGLAPLMSYQHGAGNAAEKRSLFRRGIAVTVGLGVGMFGVAQLVASPLASLFTSYDPELQHLAAHAFGVYSVAFLLMGFTYFGSSMFTAVENGRVSAVISFAHTFVFEIGAVMLLPLVVGVEGIWWAISVAEIAAGLLTFAFLTRYGRRYGWLGAH
mgnify:CR=1 FL=1